MELWTIRRVLDWTAKDLSERGIDTPRLDAEVLLAHALGTDRLGLFLDLGRPLDPAERTAYRKLIARRRLREPVAQLTGQREFWSLELEIDRHVLVPRPETEVLVEEALELLPSEEPALLVDVGTGSGCISLALLSERADLRVLAIDIDRRATKRAVKNAAKHDLSDRMSVVIGDLLEPVGGPVDLVVANLPYIPSAEIGDLEPEVSEWEPRRALDGGEDGLDLFRLLLPQAHRVLRPGGGLVLEVGHGDQAHQVEELLDSTWEHLHTRRDYGQTPRVVVARRR